MISHSIVLNFLLQLAVYVSDQIPETLVGDPGRIRQIITNFMGNSIKVGFHCQIENNHLSCIRKLFGCI
jgi:signal transduction histidine kinase